MEEENLIIKILFKSLDKSFFKLYNNFNNSNKITGGRLNEKSLNIINCLNSICWSS